MPTPKLNHLDCVGAAGPHRMAYWQWGDERAGHCIVCVHGLARQGRDFDALAQSLLQASPIALRVVCPDLAGRGQSDWLAEPVHYVPATYAADLVALLGALHAQAPLTRLGWVGTSLGGVIGIAVCGSPQLPLPLPIGRLVLNDVGPQVSWQALLRIRTYLGETGRFDSLPQAAQALASISQEFGRFTEQDWLALCEPMLRALAEGGYTLHYDPAIALPVRALTEAAAAQAQPMLWQLYDRITARTLLVRGADSDLLTPETAHAMSQRGPCAEVIEFADVGHAPMFNTPQQRAPVLDFLLRPEPEPEP